MPAPSASKEEIVERLFVVFRDRGFEGASLADLSRATGLGKSSLYHYFPQGKTQMAEAVLGRAVMLIDSAVLGVAHVQEPLKARVRKIVTALREMYADGRTPCVLGQLSSATIGTDARAHLLESFEHWTQGIEILAAESGLQPARARQFAEDWVARLQGTLILQAATGNTGPFERALQALLDLAKKSPES